MRNRHPCTLPAVALLALSLAACSRDDAPKTPAEVARAAHQQRVADEIAMTLQACSYEGETLQVDPGKLGGKAPADCGRMVDRIMDYTGLPKNFVVSAGPVPNALAVILLDKQRVPRRVIAFNPDFIAQVKAATGGDNWAPVSIMAHEIGHHLSGHTITEGHSRPEIELEADKFSGYVLYKMGAPLADSTTAIMAMGSPTEHPPHPARDRRAAAITQGWREACRQSGSDRCASGSGTSTAPGATPRPPAQLLKVSLPAPAPDAIPFKYGRFVVDETGKLDAGKLGELDKRLYDLANTQGLELALLVVDDLHGMNAEDYAWAMMRQLRIGKLDLGNGGVLVLAPNHKQAGVALAPGVARQLEDHNTQKQLRDWIDFAWTPDRCLGPQGCGTSIDLLMTTMDRAMKRAGEVKWEIRFRNIEDVIAYSNDRRAERKQGRKWDDKLDQTLGSLARFRGTVTELDPRPDFNRVNEATLKDGRWRAVLVKTDQGREVTLYMQPQTPGLMPSGALQVGKQYTFTGELKTTGQFTTDKGVLQGNPGLWLFSYDALD
jgi:hypothetical protein